MLQGSASVSPDYLDADEPRYEAFEFKSEVVWGRAYFAELVLPEGGSQTYWLRGATESAAEIHDPHALEERRRWGWLREEGHLACVWRLAERVARAAAIDQMRVDIFVAKGDPDGCMVNENSLSSGSDTWPHRMYVALLWAEGHERGLYEPFGNESSTQAHLQTAADLPPST